ncbi:LysR family transcriptional regulator [Vibrio sp. SM6]|uniref:LysR family transcriptional regulator n=1 Tax=Vibrio agarilyticus TaxID=2726741 RepID=A0A7X8TRY6_9VIBR|nr:LysR family transcriptional regulator [Vibrio agarilyticus]NLS13669.1 LysR family transcriptional regulator [Vibrio agarilyticus]
MDIDNIRLFLHVADQLNISRAARACGLTPAKASLRLNKMEHQLGVSLFHRSTRSVSLSSEGAQFRPFAEEILRQHRLATEQLSPGIKQCALAGTLRFAASSTFADRYIVPLLNEFFVRYPQINLELHFSDQPVNLVASGIDVALRNIKIESCNLKARKLADDERYLYAAPSYLAQFGTPMQPADLNHHHMILFANQRKRRLLNSASNQLAYFPPSNARTRMVCDNGNSMRLATLAGIGISMNSYWSVADDVEAGRLVPVLPRYQVDDNSALWLVYPNSINPSPKVRALIDYLVEKLGDRPPWQKIS